MKTRILSLAAAGLLMSPAAFAQGGSATYELTFQSTWSRTTHPIDWPGFPHYSSLIGGTHNGNVEFWKPGGLATRGIEAMAETGSTFSLSQEIQTAISAKTADKLVRGGALGRSPSSLKVRFTVDRSHPRLTLVTMLAPSPDWFVGVNGYELFQNGKWIDNATVPLKLWDAGTDSGTTYAAPNRDTQPRERIAVVTQAVGPFKGYSTTVGNFIFRRVAETQVTGCGTNPAGSMTVNGQALLGQTVTLAASDPSNSIAKPAASVVLFGASAPAGFPCGLKIPGLGLSGMNGELLVDGIFATTLGAAWNGTPVQLPLSIPRQSTLLGARLYMQVALVNGTKIGLTDGATLFIGQ